MKKSYLLVLGIFLTAFLLFLSPNASYADDIYQLDQRQLEGEACVTAYSEYHHNQTFKNTYNVLTKVGVRMKHMNGGNINLIIKDEVTGAIIVNVEQRMGVGDDWIYFDLVDDALGYIINADHTHSMWIGTSYYPGVDTPCWVYTGTENYSYGVRRQGLTEKSGDLTFVTFGYAFDFGRENPEPPPADNPPADDPPADGPVDNNPEGEEEAGVEEGIGETPDEAQDAGTVLVEEDESVTSPSLDSVIKNKEIVDLVEDDGKVEVTDEDVIQITGTADPGDEVSVIVGDKAYTATADEDGNWYVLFGVTDLEDGDYPVTAQSKNEEGKGSEKVEMFVLSKSTVIELVDTTEGEDTEEISLFNRLYTGNLRYITLIVLLLLVCGLFWLLITIRRKKEEKKEGKIEKKEEKIEKEIKE